MSKTIDERVVSMQFDNKNFESNVQTSMSTLEKLKNSLNFTGAAKGFENVSSAANRVNMSGLGSAVESVKMKFSALEVMGVTALANITNSAVNAGKRMISALTIDPIKTGFQEYETQINAVQTILANTSSKGTTLDQVNKALDELNLYADKTIYNFTEMTRNIGTFTAAGVDLDTSVSAIKGIANLAAVSGSTSQQASTAMYQLSQALAAGTVKLMDWNSVVNAGMGGQVFQDALKETARVHGIAIDDMIEDEGSFRETLQNGWLSSEILTETLAKFTGDLTEEQLKSMGYTEEQIKSIIKMGETANDAATKVKTFTQLWDTLKEAAQSGWTQSWEIMIGDFEEAKELLTEVSDTFGAILGKSADARNEVLQGWKDLGGRTAIIDAFRNAFEGIGSIIKPISEAFKEIFPPITAKQLYNFSVNLKNLTEKLKLSSETADKVKRIFKGVFSIFDLGRKAVTALIKPLFDLSQSKGISSLADLLLSAAAAIGDFFTSINEGASAGEFFSNITSALSKTFGGISKIIGSVADGFHGFGKAFESVYNWILGVAGKIANGIGTAFNWISDHVSIGDIFAGLAGGGIFLAAKKISGFLDKIIDSLKEIFGKDEGSNIKEQFSDILGSIHDSLDSFSTGIKVGSLVAIAVAIGILSASLKTIANLDADDIAKSISAIGVMMAELCLTFKSLTKTLKANGSGGIVKAGASLILMAAAIKILAGAIEKFSKLSLGEIGKGLVGVGGGLIALCSGLKIIGKTKISLSTSIAMLALASSCEMLGSALQKFSTLSWSEIARGLTAMGGALGEFVITLSVLKKFSGGKSIFGAVGLLIAVQSLEKMAAGLKTFAEMSWNEIGRGLTAMGGALGELTIVLGGLGKFSGFSSIFAAGAISIVIQNLGELADALQKFGWMSWGEIGRGLTAMGGVLLEVASISGALGKIAGFSSIFGAGAITLTIHGLDDLAAALEKFGGMSWDEIGRGLAAMGGALLEVAGISGALGYFAGIAGILGAGVIAIATKGLDDLANSLQKFGEMSWDEIGRGLTAMGAALGEVALGGLLNTLSGLGAMSIANVAEPLGVLADSVKKWAGVTVPENLGQQLGSLAWGIMKFTFGEAGASAISEVAGPLGTMADSVKKWTGVVVPENLGIQMGQLADGIKKFTFGGLGAVALSEAAGPLGTMADSVKKWSGVTVPENLGSQLTSLANGVKSFSFAFAGGWSISAVNEPLSNLADSVKKWNGVAIPESLETGLKSVANGIKSFSFAFAGGWSIDGIAGPLGSLAESVKKWSGITIPDSLESGLKKIADGVQQFSLLDAAKISAIDGPLKTLSTAFKNFSGINTTGDKLVTFAKNIKTCSSELSGINTTAISSASSTISTLVNTVKKVNSTNTSNVTAFVNAANKLNNIKIDGIKVDSGGLSSAISAIKKTMSSMSKTISSSKSSIDSAMKTAVSGVGEAIKSKKSSVTSAGKDLVSALTKAIKSKKSSITSACKTLVSGAASGIKEHKSSFKSAGQYLGSGLVEGIKAKKTAAYNAGYALGQAAVQGEKDGQKSNSPSKLTIQAGKWIGEGLIIGMETMGSQVYRSGKELGSTATGTISSAISRIADVIDSDMDVQPTIRPVLDLSNIKSGAGSIGSMLNNKSSIYTMANAEAISYMTNRRIQNGANSDVVSAIDKLRKDVGNLESRSYTIGGITYSAGDEVSNAIETLVRAVRVEGRV